jgi:hypothetical protein
MRSRICLLVCICPAACGCSCAAKRPVCIWHCGEALLDAYRCPFTVPFLHPDGTTAGVSLTVHASALSSPSSRPQPVPPAFLLSSPLPSLCPSLVSPTLAPVRLVRPRGDPSAVYRFLLSLVRTKGSLLFLVWIPHLACPSGFVLFSIRLNLFPAHPISFFSVRLGSPSSAPNLAQLISE